MEARNYNEIERRKREILLQNEDFIVDPTTLPKLTQIVKDFDPSHFDYLIQKLRSNDSIEMKYLIPIGNYFKEMKEKIRIFELTNGVEIDLTTPNILIRCKKIPWKTLRYFVLPVPRTSAIQSLNLESQGSAQTNNIIIPTRPNLVPQVQQPAEIPEVQQQNRKLEVVKCLSYGEHKRLKEIQRKKRMLHEKALEVTKSTQPIASTSAVPFEKKDVKQKQAPSSTNVEHNKSKEATRREEGNKQQVLREMKEKALEATKIIQPIASTSAVPSDVRTKQAPPIINVEHNKSKEAMRREQQVPSEKEVKKSTQLIPSTSAVPMDVERKKRSKNEVLRKVEEIKRPRVTRMSRSLSKARKDEMPLKNSKYPKYPPLCLSPLVPSSESSFLTASSDLTLTSTFSTTTNETSNSVMIQIKLENEKDVVDDDFFDQRSETSDTNEDTSDLPLNKENSTSIMKLPVKSKVSVSVQTEKDTSVISFSSSGYSTSNTRDFNGVNALLNIKEEPIDIFHDAPTQVLPENLKSEVKTEGCDENYDGDASTDREDMFEVDSEASDDKNNNISFETCKEIDSDIEFLNTIGQEETYLENDQGLSPTCRINDWFKNTDFSYPPSPTFDCPMSEGSNSEDEQIINYLPPKIVKESPI